MDWFLYDNGLHLERVNIRSKTWKRSSVESTRLNLSKLSADNFFQLDSGKTANKQIYIQTLLSIFDQCRNSNSSCISAKTAKNHLPGNY